MSNDMSNDTYDWPCYNCGSNGLTEACYACWAHVLPKLRTRCERLEELLKRYRTEIPLGRQPAMIALEVDEVLEAEW